MPPDMPKASRGTVSNLSKSHLIRGLDLDVQSRCSLCGHSCGLGPGPLMCQHALSRWSPIWVRPGSHLRVTMLHKDATCACKSYIILMSSKIFKGSGASRCCRLLTIRTGMHQAFPAGSLRSRGHLPPGAGAERNWKSSSSLAGLPRCEAPPGSLCLAPRRITEVGPLRAQDAALHLKRRRRRRRCFRRDSLCPSGSFQVVSTGVEGMAIRKHLEEDHPDP